MNNVKSELREFLYETFEIDREDEDFTDDVDFFAYGYVDSFGAAEIISYLEAKYNIEITNKDLVKYPMTSIDEIDAYIEIKAGS